MKNKMVICPYCEGSGMVMDWADDVVGNTISFTHSCDCCEGEGKILESQYEIAKEVYPKPNRVYVEEIEGK